MTRRSQRRKSHVEPDLASSDDVHGDIVQSCNVATNAPDDVNGQIQSNAKQESLSSSTGSVSQDIDKTKHTHGTRSRKSGGETGSQLGDIVQPHDVATNAPDDVNGQIQSNAKQESVPLGSSTGSLSQDIDKTKHTHGTRSRKSGGETGSPRVAVTDSLGGHDCRKNVNLRTKCDQPDELTNERQITQQDCNELKRVMEFATEADTKDGVCKKVATVHGVATRTRHHVSQNTEVALVNPAVDDCETKPEPLPAVSTTDERTEGSALRSRSTRSKFKLKKDKPKADNIVSEKPPSETVPIAGASVAEARRSKSECPPDGGPANIAIQSVAAVGHKVVSQAAGDSGPTETSLSKDGDIHKEDETAIVEVSA